MNNLNNDLSELVSSRISIYDKMCYSSLFLHQLDFLAFWVDTEKLIQNRPFNSIWDLYRDNPNWETTIYDNVYQLVEEDKIVLQYVRDWFSPVAILQWYKMKVKTSDWWSTEKWKISIYWKWLRLYYCWFLDWLPDYIDLYCGDVIRADLCWDTKEKISENVVDLKNTITYWDWENRSYKGFWNKRSPLFIRIYDKTLDLARDHNSMARLYPDWYINSCWRIECKFTWRYANSMTALQWLWVCDRSWSIQKVKNSKRDYLKSAFYNLLMYIDFIPDRKKQYDLLSWISIQCGKKMKKLKNFISLDSEND